MKKPYLVDVPVQIYIWIREEEQRRQFEMIKIARPSVIILASDGGRNEEEWKAIENNRRLYDEVDWECEIIRVFFDKNKGALELLLEANKVVWDRFDYCIYLEDDVIPEPSFFRYCKELLEKYKNDCRIFMICGMNHIGINEDVNTDYFFSRYGSLCGFAIWKRSMEQYWDFEYGKDQYVMKLLLRRSKRLKRHQRAIRAYANSLYYNGLPAGDEFYTTLAVYAHNQVMIIPRRNLTCNVGVGVKATHGDDIRRLPRGIRRVYYMETYPMSFPMTHAKYVIPDVYYENKRNRILAFGHPFVTLYRKIERGILVLIRGDFRYFIKKIRKQSL